MLQFLIPLLTSLLSGSQTAGMKTKNPATGVMSESPSGGSGVYNAMGGWQGILSSVMGSGSTQGKRPTSSPDFGTQPDPAQQQMQAFFSQVILPMLLKQRRI